LDRSATSSAQIRPVAEPEQTSYPAGKTISVKGMNWRLLFMLLHASTLVLAQKQANVWHFGFGHSLDFSSGVPIQATGSAIQTFEGSTSYSDSLGNFLFYTNGGGREPAISGQDGGHIWNRNNGVMYDMQGVEGGGFSSRQSAVAFEAPGQSDVYYVFTMDEIEYTVGASPATNSAQPLGRGLRYFTIDMSQNSGLGSVVLADQPVYAPSAEGLCAIRHANKIDYWILINQDSTGIGVYSVTSSGVNFITNYTATGGGPGIIKASPDGSKVRTGEYLLDFNSSNGQLSNPLNLSASEFFEFSPNGRFLYDLQSPSVGPIVVSRYDLQAASIPSSISTIGIINAGLGATGGQMQLGPDGKIYFLEVNFPANTVTMHRVNCPNTLTASVQLNVFSYTGYFVGLPNYPAWLFENNDSTYVELGPDTVNLCDVGGTYVLNALNPGASYQWSTGATTQTIAVSTPGVYSVTVNGPCGTGTDQIVITNCNSNPCLVFLPTGAPQQWVVPAGVDTIRIKMWGAAGGGGPDPANNSGGGGGYTELIVPAVAGDTLQIVVGTGGGVASGHTGGAGGYGGGGDGGSGNRVETVFGVPSNVGGAGGGGGLTLVRMTGSINTILGIAGGGGGGSFNRYGGGGGGLVADFTAANNPFNIHGFGGTQTAGGAPSSNTICGHPVSGMAGAGQQGGMGATDFGGSAERTGGGGGGGGYFGGGGGGSHDGCFGVGSAGGGGSGFVCTACPGLSGFTLVAGFAGAPANASDSLLTTYPGTATGALNQNGGGGLVQICTEIGCIPTTDSLTVTACDNFIDPNGFVLTQSGIYSFMLISTGGCDSMIVLDLTITSVAVGDTIIASTCNNYTAPWGTVYSQSGLYSDTLVFANACDSIVTVNLTITGPILTSPFTASACSSYTAPWGAIYTQSGLYTDTLTTANGCDSIVTVNLTITGTVIAPTLTVNACNSYTAPWGTVYTQSGTYSDTLVTTSGCDSIVSVNLTVNISVISPPITANACETYTTPWGSVYTQSGSYTDTLRAANGCDSIVSVNLTIYPDPTVQVSASGPTIIGLGGSLQLNASGALNYQWSPSTGLSCSNCSSPVATPSGSITYIVTGTDSNGCSSTASISITVDIRCNELFIPDIFSPDGIGPPENEQVCVFSNCIRSMNMAIYDRWGQVIFSTEDPLQCWNGMKDGKEVPTGVYVYRLFVRQIDGKEISKSGNITLIR